MNSLSKWRLIAVISVVVFLGGLFTLREKNYLKQPYQGDITIPIVPAIPQLTLDELTDSAGSIVIGKIEKKMGTVMLSEPYDQKDAEEYINELFTDYSFTIEQSLKGSYEPDTSVVIRMTGGEMDGIRVLVSDEYQFRTGDYVLLFLEKEVGPNGEVYIMTAEQGIFDIKGGKITGRAPHFGEEELSEFKNRIVNRVGPLQ